ncbi:hypothetical protein [Oceanimonas marisflavi]|uniref:hypothetical protein n=1 Tax=Oceanimonas marisflavi TaxID=2059724 RepID=UPI001300346C|nr:hypothetical protein [Oceanimonas marisflavi]
MKELRYLLVSKENYMVCTDGWDITIRYKKPGERYWVKYDSEGRRVKKPCVLLRPTLEHYAEIPYLEVLFHMWWLKREFELYPLNVKSLTESPYSIDMGIYTVEQAAPIIREMLIGGAF